MLREKERLNQMFGGVPHQNERVSSELSINADMVRFEDSTQNTSKVAARRSSALPSKHTSVESIEINGQKVPPSFHQSFV